MFDNEIDWVTGLEELRARREARERRKIPNMFEYKAEHKQLSSGKTGIQASVQLKSVFRRYSDCTRERARLISEAEK